jgi:hypothetical protein
MTTTKFFLSYTGVKLPLKLVGELDEAETRNRNTFIRASYDADDRLTRMEKMVYGDVELLHVYSYRPDGTLSRAEVTIDDETTAVDF